MKMKGLLKMHAWGKLLLLSCKNNRSDVFSSLPDDIVEDILVRLPIKSVLSCKRVCSRWYRITSTKQFARVHLKRGADAVNLSMFERFGVSCPYKRRVFAMKGHITKGLTLEREHIIKPKLNSTIQDLQIISSCDGLVLLKRGRSINTGYGKSYVISNPTTKEIASFMPPREFKYAIWHDELRRKDRVLITDIVGFFYDEIRCEYRVLQYELADGDVTYYVYGLRSKSEKNLGTYKLHPSRQYEDRSIFVDGKLCWIVYYVANINQLVKSCSQCVMFFELESETLHCIPHPAGYKCDPQYNLSHNCIKLVVLDNGLGLSVSTHYTITIWVLEGSGSFTWNMRYVIEYDAELRSYPVICNDYPPYAQVLNVVDGELVLSSSSKGYFTRNLRTKALRKLKINEDDPNLQIRSVLHLKSLVSPKHIYD